MIQGSHPMAPQFLMKDAPGCPRNCLPLSWPKWKREQKSTNGFYGPGLEMGHITSSHISMARTHSHGHSWTAREVRKYNLSLCPPGRVNRIGDPPYPEGPFVTIFVFIGFSPLVITLHIYLLTFHCLPTLQCKFHKGWDSVLSTTVSSAPSIVLDM